MPSPIRSSPLDPNSGASPAVRFLTNGHSTVLITSAGTGHARVGDIALTAGSEGRLDDSHGSFLHIRDLESRAGWILGRRPGAPAEGPNQARWRPGRFTIAREVDGIEAHLDVCVAPDADAELRRITLANRSPARRTLELTTYAEVVLDHPSAYAGHPAFSKLFVQTEFLPERLAILARRRPRSASERFPWLVHALLGGREVQAETDRSRFLGRHPYPAMPQALIAKTRLSGTAGNVLDPIVSLRWKITVEAGATARCAYMLGAAAGRDEALDLVARFSGEGTVEAALRDAETTERDRIARAGLSEAEAEACQALAGAMLTGDPALRAAPELLARAGGRLGDLARLGMGLHRAFVVAHLDRPAVTVFLPELLKAHRYWQALGLPIDLVLAGGERIPDGLPVPGEGSVPPLHIPRGTAGPAELDLIDAAARWVAEESPLAAAARLRGFRPAPVGVPARRARAEAPAGSTERTQDLDGPRGLTFFNGLGGFTEAGDEYVIRLPGGPARCVPPRPWTNVIANDRFGFLVSETGAGTTWSGNSREHRLTPWFNDAVLDPHGEALYIRDEDSGAFWSPMPGPVPHGGTYELRHGFGYTACHHTAGDLAVETTLFAHREDPLRFAALRLRNRGRRPRRLSLFAYYRLVLGTLPEESGRFVVTEIDPASKAVFAYNRLAGEFAEAVTFAAAAAPSGGRALHATGDREAFLGRNGTAAAPRALRDAAPLDGRVGAGLDPCIAQQVVLEIPPGETAEVFFLFGEARGAPEARELIARNTAPEAVAQALEDARDFWRDGLSGLRVATPSPALDFMVNGWLPYQTLACRIRGRTAFYQSGGAFGFRDQLQDAAALIPLWPAVARDQILLNAAHQFVEGDVLHWWHPPLSRGIRTRFADDLVWLPYLTAQYVRTTGDAAILEETTRFLVARALAPGEDEAFLEPEDSGTAADLYEHCCRALDRALTRGPHGLPLFGSGDWNDGMNRVGREGKGESVWMGFFLFAALGDFLPFCEARGDGSRVERYRAHRAQLHQALETAGWDGGWYRRAYYDDGTPLGTRDDAECRIDGLAQAWAVLSGAAPRDRAETAMDAVEAHLISETDGIIRLLTPPFDSSPRDPGYIKGYLPGVRENGGQYTHAALWVLRALAQLGRNDRAGRLLEMLLPVNHARDAEEVATYQVEPYVVAADVYGAPPHVGRGGWTWYTGSSGWMYRVAVESLLGFTLERGETLVIAPCVPDAWPGFSIGYRLPGEDTRYEILAGNPGHRGRGVASATLDGEPVAVREGAARIPLVHDGRLHRVAILLGAGEEPGA